MTRDRRRGFTLIELMVAIGIILLLVSIAIIGYQKLDKVAGEKATQTRLALCASILSEYETAATLNGVEGSGGIYAAGAGVNSPGNVSVGAGARYNMKPTPPPPADANYPVYNTAYVMIKLLQLPTSKSMIGQLPGSAMLTASTGTNAAGITSSSGWFDTTTNGSAALPVVVDAWKNPIIYVPSGGLAGVTLGKQMSSGTTVITAVTGHIYTVKSVDNRPFWASAGQDGNFSYGDDNLYSCQVVYIQTGP